MAEHHSKATVQANYWCKPCGGPQPHTVADGRRGSCMTCMKRLDAAPRVTPPARQDSLFALNGFDDVQYASGRQSSARTKTPTAVPKRKSSR